MSLLSLRRSSVSRPQKTTTEKELKTKLTSENGIYLCLIMCLICLRIVTKKSAQK